ncbi:hypothetical protein ACIQ6Y_14555 [Streptomyces sp. NPDC096205]|uniref:hypothetical protein n=1 Tax=Streptomyces sp. NPDC096205 TaxID=3366081 RepID=UPI00380E0D76
MDAGLAGLLGGIIGAAVGAVGAVGSAAVTGRKAENQARIQSQMQLQQLRMQIRADTVRQQHDPRREAYANFLTQARRIGESKANIYMSLHNAYIDRETRPTEEIVSRIHEPLDELTGKLNVLTELWSMVNVVGPDSLYLPASRLYRVACEIVEGMLEYSHEVNIAIMENSIFPDPEDSFTRDASLDQALLEASSNFLDTIRPILDIESMRI